MEKEGRKIYMLLLTPLLALLISFILIAFLYPDKKFIYCSPGNETCLQVARHYRNLCIPALEVIDLGNSTNYVRFIFDIERLWFGECRIKENVKKFVLPLPNVTFLKNEDLKYFENNSVTCTGSEREGKYDMTCNGSIYELISAMSSAAGGEGEGGESGGKEENVFYCGYNSTCKKEVIKSIENCVERNIVDFDSINVVGAEMSFWTKRINIERRGSDCVIFFKVLNAINLPPSIPPDIVGMEMTCVIPIENLPITSLEENYCRGELFEYINLLR